MPSFFWRPKVEDEVRDELEFHVQMRVRELVARGMSPEAARNEALRRLGDAERLGTTLRALGTGRDRRRQRGQWFAELGQDIKFALRTLRRMPAVAMVVVGSLALGIGGTTTMFTVVNGVLLSQLPFPDADRLVVVQEVVPKETVRWEVAYPTFVDLRDRAKSFDQLEAYLPNGLNLTDGEETVPLSVAMVTDKFFPLLGAAPAAGRLLAEADGAPNAPAVVVISHRLWRSRFGSDPKMIGRAIQLDDKPVVVVGVAASAFRFPDEGVDLWVPIGPPQPWMLNRAVHIMHPIGRLAAGRTPADAARELGQLGTQLQQANPGADPGHAVVVAELRASIVGPIGPTLLVLLGAVGVVLLIVAVNVGGVLLTSAIGRQGEVAVRSALGAGGGRLVRQFLTESVVLAAGGGALGVALAYGGVHWLVRALPPDVPRTSEIAVNGRVLVFALATTLLTGLLFGLVPAWRGRSASAEALLHSSGARTTDGRKQRRLRQGLVVAQLAMAQVLLVSAALMLISFVRLQRVDLGFDPARLLTMTVSLPDSRYPVARATAFYEQLPDRLRQVPGVVAVSASSRLPVSGGEGRGDLTIEGRTFAGGVAPAATYRRVLPNYFRTLGVRLIRGRDFTGDDRGQGDRVTIINESMAKRFWPGGDALGSRIKVGPAEHQPWLTVVGVVGDVHNVSVDADPEPSTYEPLAQRPRGAMRLLVRTSGDPARLGAVVRRAVRAEDPLLPVYDISTMADRVSGSIGPRRFNTALLTLFGGLAVLVAVIGMWGLTARSIVERRREFGVRLALGAAPATLLADILGQSARLAAFGVVGGLGAAWLVTGWLERLLFGTRPTETGALLAASTLLAALSLAAALWPARAATRVDPMRVLREE